MPRYLVRRTLPPLSSDQLEAVKQNVVEACKQVPGMQWIRSHITADGRQSFCEFEAPSPDACRDHARRASLPVDEVIPLGLEIGPDR